MKFIHVTDTHLGKTEAKSMERELDFYSAFRQVIDRAIGERVDFVIHSGDFFDSARPSTRTLIFAVEQLMRLKKESIPLFIAIGSHDIGTDDTIITVLEKMGLLTNLSSGRYFSADGEKIRMTGELCRGAYICGLAGKRSGIEGTYSHLEPQMKNGFKIFLFHHIISDINEKFADIPTSLLPRGFDYYAGGHWHNFFESEYCDGKIIYPGSIEYNDLNEMESGKKRYFCEVDVEDGVSSVKKIEIQTRRIERIEFDCTGLSSEEVSVSSICKIPVTAEKAILILHLIGKLRTGFKSEVNRAEILDAVKMKGYLYSKIYVDSLEDKESISVETSSKSISEIEREYLEKQDYSKTEVSTAMKLLELLGSQESEENFERIKLEAIGLIGSVLLDNKGD